MNLRVVDFFAGGGGLSMGFQKAGFDVVCAVENWEPALDIYRANFHQHDAVSLDLRDEKCALRLLDTYRPDVIIGGLLVRIFPVPASAMKMPGELASPSTTPILFLNTGRLFL